VRSTRILSLLAIGVVLAGLGAATRGAVHAERTGATFAPAALIDLGALFGGGDENEPDESDGEPDDQERATARPRSTGPHVQRAASRRPMPSLVVVLLSAALAVIVAAYLARRIRRGWTRLRAWRPGR
jgi:hypothetical protein